MATICVFIQNVFGKTEVADYTFSEQEEYSTGIGKHIESENLDSQMLKD